MFNLFICPVCKFQKVKIPKKTCASCQELLADIKKSIKSAGYTTWPRLREELRISYSSVINKLEYLVKKKILLPPDESGKYFLKKK